MRILFIQDNGYHESLGISSLAGAIESEGHFADLALLSHEGKLNDIINRYSPNIIGLSSYTTNYKYYLEIARQIKSKFEIPIIMGGPHPTYYPEVIEEEGIDMICRGEGEHALIELLKALENKADYTSINNLWVKKDGGIYKNEFGNLVEDLDQLPLPKREIYYKYSFIKEFPLKRFITGLGCPYRCTFCHEPLYRSYIKGKGKFIRRKSPSRVIEEIESVRKSARLKSIHFSDDLFILNKRWLWEFSKLYRENINIRFTINARFDSLDKENIMLLKEIGCAGMAIGLETGNEHLRNSILKKKVSNRDIISGAELLHRHNIKFLTYNMTALPGETLDNALETVKLNHDIKSSYARIFTFQTFPLLELTEYARANNYLDSGDDKDFSVGIQSVNIKCDFERESRNLCSLFYLLIKLPFSQKIFKRMLKFRENIFYKIIGWLNLLQEPSFYGVSFLDSWRFFKNIYLVKVGRVDFHWIVPIKDK